jgi:hypothetical protein
MRYNYKSSSYESGVNILSIYFIEIKCINLKKKVLKNQSNDYKILLQKIKEKKKSTKTIPGRILLYFMLQHALAVIKSHHQEYIKSLQKQCLYTTQESLHYVTEISILQCYGVVRAKNQNKNNKTIYLKVH